MRAYEIFAQDATGDTVSLVTTDTATGALDKFRGALTAYQRAWVTSDNGDYVDIVELIQLARDEARTDR